MFLHATFEESRQVKITGSWYEAQYDCFLEEDASLTCRRKECTNPLGQQLLIKRITRITSISSLEDPTKEFVDDWEIYKEVLSLILAQALRDQITVMDDVLCKACREKRLAEHPLGALLAKR